MIAVLSEHAQGDCAFAVFPQIHALFMGFRICADVASGEESSLKSFSQVDLELKVIYGML